ncbi:MAG: Fur family transcriptional regulator, ferric uptake regulator [Acidobacteriota bacterium]|jgi:Fur family ferric uptake transcriptional regulator|nr:Fur family transcriptional regulator, ferric uptake regulator [Acidobacteriota bacterium]
MKHQHPPIERELARFQEFLQVQGLKLTSERSSLVREIFATHYHFEADELLGKMREKDVKISRATVYRTLELLVKSNMVRRVHLGEDHYHYEHVSGNSHHDHLICTTCGNVIEFHDEVLEQRQREICERKKFTPTFHNLQILGVCDACRRLGAQPDAPDRVKMIHANNLLRK